MLQSIYIYTLILALFTISVSAQELRFAATLPLINQNNFYTDIEVQTRFESKEDKRVNKNMATLSIEYDINKHFEVGGSYRIISKKNMVSSSENPNVFENEGARATLDFTYKTNTYNDVYFKNKLRYQVSDVNEDAHKTFLRNKVLAYYKISKKLKPYAGLELIYRLEDEELKSFRVHLGSKIAVKKRVVTGFFIIENEFKDLPVNLNYITGIKITI